MPAKKDIKKPAVYEWAFSKVYPAYIAKAEKKNRTKAEVNQVIEWLFGYDSKQLQAALDDGTTLEEFVTNGPTPNPNQHLITGVVCGVRVEDIEDETTKQVRYLDKLIDELAKGKAMEKILRQQA